eukprot:CAMPEP_0170514704 /NCGR_PEP_ID=MMETSP0209-20121228/1281_1 /TAXON_ID=665100 ORGANISM="Litonotus pictus, Strain P1" /NCGR_SAMPLE_ID=MMETSP0209 /ASSEMBLY_ACC=CAM_ASM_000301 /LENGTH=195 /DNA_ID=CAMNT_0010798901 /DNA_START=153 /DNA_END=740 /DNA_ORIENTATION=+
MHDSLGYYQEKLYSVSNNMGMGISGLTPDGRILHKYMKNECLNYFYVYNNQHPVERLVTKVSEKSQRKTFGDSKRPYGVGTLIAGADKTGPKLFRTCPSGLYYEYYAYAIGSRCQTANTYLENNLDSFPDCDLENLIRHAIEAMKKAQDISINEKNLDIGFVSQGNNFTRVDEEWLATLLKPKEQPKQSGMVVDS